MIQNVHHYTTMERFNLSSAKFLWKIVSQRSSASLQVVAKIKEQSSRSKHVTKIYWGELINASVHEIFLLARHETVHETFTMISLIAWRATLLSLGKHGIQYHREVFTCFQWLHDWLRNVRIFFVQSEVQPKPVVICLHAFSRPSCQSNAFIPTFDWFTVVSLSSVIGQSDAVSKSKPEAKRATSTKRGKRRITTSRLRTALDWLKKKMRLIGQGNQIYISYQKLRTFYF